MVVTILTDIIHFGIYYPSADLIGRDLFRFSAGMAILSLLLKPVSCFFVYQMYRERGGDYNVTFGKCSNFIIKCSLYTLESENFLHHALIYVSYCTALKSPDLQNSILDLSCETDLLPSHDFSDVSDYLSDSQLKNLCHELLMMFPAIILNVLKVLIHRGVTWSLLQRLDCVIDCNICVANVGW